MDRCQLGEYHLLGDLSRPSDDWGDPHWFLGGQLIAGGPASGPPVQLGLRHEGVVERGGR